MYNMLLRAFGSIAFLLSIASAHELGHDADSTNAYVLKAGPLDTPWTTSVGTSPWPEYPRPQLARSHPAQWKNLNGVWQYRNSTKEEYENLTSIFVGGELEGAQPVLVPFCLESALSGELKALVYGAYR